MFKYTFQIIFTFLIGFQTFGQGKIRGEVKDVKSGEPIPYASVKIEGQNKGGTTDFDGKYSINNVSAGTYTLIFSASLDGFIDQKKEVTVKSGETSIVSIDLSKDSTIQVIKGAVVKANKIRGGGIVDVDKERMKSKGPTDGTGQQQISETGAGDGGEAAQQITGLSVEGGKSVYVRGLGDRYTKTILNFMEIPGLDPDRNAVQLDIFPSTIIENITVYKTFIPNLSGDFTGGLVDITTREFPLKKTIYFSGGLGWNSQATFNKNYIGYQGGKFDFLGFDDGGRRLPLSKYAQIPDATANDPILTSVMKLFNPVMTTEPSGNFLDQNYTFSIGEQINFDKKVKLDYGYNVVLNYRNNHRFYDDVQFNEFRKDTDSTERQLFEDRRSSGLLAENDVLWSGLIGQSIKFNQTNKISLTLFHTQNGKTSASTLTQINNESNPAILEKTSLQYTQRSISNANLNGLHYLDTLKKWKFTWRASPTYSRITDPDIRSTVLEILDVPGPNGEDVYALTPAVGAEIRRIYRDLTEFNIGGRADIDYSFVQWDSLKSTLSFGASNIYKTRSFETYDLNFVPEKLTTFSSDPNWYFQEENIWTVEKDSGMVVKGQSEPANNFDASINVMGGYVMNQLPLTKNLEATYGVRAEHAVYKYTGVNNLGTSIFLDSTVLNELSILPSLNMVYRISKEADSNHYERNTNFRLAYTQTVARPSFREKSIAQIYDPIQGRRYNGNIDLLQTRVHNADLRWEYFFGRTELLSASAFYKRFINPIEIVAFDLAPSEVKPVNAGVADVYGVEVEGRKTIGFNKEGKEHLNLVVGANFTYVVSRIDMRQVFLDKGGELVAEKTLREENAREGEVIGNYRSMYGQSPYIINGFLTFRNDSLGLVANLSYNVQGKKLAVIGVGKTPDVFELPFHSLNFKASKKFGKDNRWKASISANNILMSARRRVYESFGDSADDLVNDRLYDYFNQGMNVSASIAITLKK